jgi:outer membrane protein assembly factor BamD
MMSLRKSSLVALALAAACASGKNDVDITKPVSGAEASNASKAYEKGLEERRTMNYLEATRYFEFVKNNFPYSQYAALAELAVADMYYDRDEWAGAANTYADFVKNHPSHPQAPYASYRVGLAHWQDRPSSFFLFPPPYEKDLAPVRAALEGFQHFLNQYPKSEFVPQAQITANEARDLLAAHERYVAEYYAKHGQWRGAAQRYLTLADSFGDLHDGKVRADSLRRAANAFHEDKDFADERTTLVRLVQEDPDDPNRPKAEARIQQIPADLKPPELQPLPLPGQSRRKKPAGASQNTPQTEPTPGVPAGQELQQPLPESEKPAPAAEKPQTEPAAPTEQPTPQTTPPTAEQPKR